MADISFCFFHFLCVFASSVIAKHFETSICENCYINKLCLLEKKRKEKIIWWLIVWCFSREQGNHSRSICIISDSLSLKPICWPCYKTWGLRLILSWSHTHTALLLQLLVRMLKLQTCSPSVSENNSSFLTEVRPSDRGYTDTDSSGLFSFQRKPQ